MRHDGMRRGYYVHVPPGLDPSQPMPVIIVLHGRGGRGLTVIKGGWNDVADRYGFIGVYPDGYDRTWNDGRVIPRSKAYTRQVDDVGFVRAILGREKQQYPVDDEKIYVAGISNGGHMSYRLACELSDEIAGIAAVVALLPERLATACLAREPVKVLMMVGTEDPFITFEGGQLGEGHKSRGRVLSAEDTAEFWRKKNGCRAGYRDIELPDRAPDDGTRVVKRPYDGCAPGGDVVFYKVVGGGHTWPGEDYQGIFKLLKNVSGKVSHDISANEEIMRFFGLR